MNAAIAYPMTVAARTVSKLRRRIIPLLFLLYVVAYLDRINIGFAAFTMNRELGITSTQFGLLTVIFFWGYFLFEIPSNLILHKVGARLWIARILVSWGAVATLTGLVHNTFQLYVVRFLLGVAEAGFYPGILLYFTYWFPAATRARMLAIFCMGIPVSNILGAPLSAWLLSLEAKGLHGWQWMYLLEAIPTFGLGLLALKWLPDNPATANWLSTREK